MHGEVFISNLQNKKIPFQMLIKDKGEEMKEKPVQASTI